MNKKLEDIKNAGRLIAAAIPEEGPNELDYNIGKGYDEGFEAAIALNLPVLFAEWKDNMLSSYELRVGKTNGKFLINDIDQKEYSNKELYDYWLTNIYKPEP